MELPLSTYGKMGELLVTADLLAKQCEVYREVTENTSVDLVVRYAETYHRIQVKTVVSSENGVVGVPLTKTRRGKLGEFTKISYLDGRVDVIALAVLDRKEVVYLACRDATSKTCVSVRFQPPKNKTQNVRYASELTFEKAFAQR